VPSAFPPGAKIALAEYRSRPVRETAVDTTESYDTFRRALAECRNAEIVDLEPDSNADVVLRVELEPRMIQGSKAQGKDTATVAVIAKVSGFDRHGVLVWGDDVVVYSPRFSINGVYAARLQAATSAANADAAATLVHRFCGRLPPVVTTAVN
jgi:hypothetical protein